MQERKAGLETLITGERLKAEKGEEGAGRGEPLLSRETWEGGKWKIQGRGPAPVMSWGGGVPAKGLGVLTQGWVGMGMMFEVAALEAAYLVLKRASLGPCSCSSLFWNGPPDLRPAPGISIKSIFSEGSLQSPCPWWYTHCLHPISLFYSECLSLSEIAWPVCSLVYSPLPRAHTQVSASVMRAGTLPSSLLGPHSLTQCPAHRRRCSVTTGKVMRGGDHRPGRVSPVRQRLASCKADPSPGVDVSLAVTRGRLLQRSSSRLPLVQQACPLPEVGVSPVRDPRTT